MCYRTLVYHFLPFGVTGLLKCKFHGYNPADSVFKLVTCIVFLMTYCTHYGDIALIVELYHWELNVSVTITCFTAVT